MSARLEGTASDGTEHAETIREIRPWREAGWIFRDGDALAIERQGERTRPGTDHRFPGREE